MEYKKIEPQINDFVGDNVKRLAQIFPSAVKDGQVDFQALKEELGQFEEVGSEKYELTWAGKQNAKKIAQEDVYGKTLKFIPEESVNADTTENLYIEGDNLEVLKLLRQNYYGAIKMIYIDPPYNTGNDFVYNDNFKVERNISEFDEGYIDETGERLQKNSSSYNRYHANWLNMMYTRLKVAKELLREDGIIFISIDDSEHDNLQKLCNEIFGEQNFISNIIWQRAFAPKNDAKYLSTNHDYILMFAKNINAFNIRKLDRSDEANKRYKNLDNDPRGVWISDNLTAKTYSEKYDYSIVTPNGRTVKPSNGSCWRVSKEKFKELVLDNRIWFGSDGGNVPRLKRFLSEVQDGMVPLTMWLSQDVGHNQEGRQELKKIFNDKGYFDGPKPTRLIKRLIHIANLQNDDIILDFFSGSGTTADATISYNYENNTNYKFILVQLPENIDKETYAYKDGYHTICEIGKERIRRRGERLKKEYKGQTIDDGFKVFKIARTNIRWNNVTNINELQLTMNDSNINDGSIDFYANTTDIDIVYEIMLHQRGIPLSSKLIKLLDRRETRVYVYASSYVICLEDKITKDLVDMLSHINPLPIKFIFRDSAFGDDIALKDETIRRLKALIEKNSGTSKKAYTVEFI